MALKVSCIKKKKKHSDIFTGLIASYELNNKPQKKYLSHFQISSHKTRFPDGEQGVCYFFGMAALLNE